MSLTPVLLNGVSEAALAAAEKEPVDEFSAAFAQITAAEAAATTGSAAPGKTVTEGEASPKVAAPGVADEGEAARDAAATKAKADADAAAAAGITEPDDAAKEAERVAAEAKAAEDAAKAAAAGPKIDDDELVRRLAGLIKNPPAPARAEQTTQTVEPFKAEVSPEAQAVIAEYMKEYGDIAKGEQAVRAVEYQHLLNFAFTQIQAAFQPKFDQLQALMERTHLGDVQARVPDYNATREAVVEWVAKQPPYVKVAYEYVIERGTAEEVQDLVARYKAANPPTPEQLAATAAAEAAKVGTVAPPKVAVVDPAKAAQAAAVARAAAALAPVGSKRTGAVPQAEPTNFDDAFSHFAKLAEMA
jgi:hypothetical protein